MDRGGFRVGSIPIAIKAKEEGGVSGWRWVRWAFEQIWREVVKREVRAYFYACAVEETIEFISVMGPFGTVSTGGYRIVVLKGRSVDVGGLWGSGCPLR